MAAVTIASQNPVERSGTTAGEGRGTAVRSVTGNPTATEAAAATSTGPTPRSLRWPPKAEWVRGPRPPPPARARLRPAPTGGAARRPARAGGGDRRRPVRGVPGRAPVSGGPAGPTGDGRAGARLRRQHRIARTAGRPVDV